LFPLNPRDTEAGSLCSLALQPIKHFGFNPDQTHSILFQNENKKVLPTLPDSTFIISNGWKLFYFFPSILSFRACNSALASPIVGFESSCSRAARFLASA